MGYIITNNKNKFINLDENSKPIIVDSLKNAKVWDDETKCKNARRNLSPKSIGIDWYVLECDIINEKDKDLDIVYLMNLLENFNIESFTNFVKVRNYIQNNKKQVNLYLFNLRAEIKKYDAKTIDLLHFSEEEAKLNINQDINIDYLKYFKYLQDARINRRIIKDKIFLLTSLSTKRHFSTEQMINYINSYFKNRKYYPKEILDIYSIFIE